MPTFHPQARLQESQRQCDALLQGVSYMVPQRMLTLFTWAQLETLTCGSADIDVDLLRSRTKYGVGVSPKAMSAALTSIAVSAVAKDAKDVSGFLADEHPIVLAASPKRDEEKIALTPPRRLLLPESAPFYVCG